jgi:hypothetical protein
MERLAGADATVIDAGEAVIIQTPTAGGYGRTEPLIAAVSSEALQLNEAAGEPAAPLRTSEI